MYYQFDQSSQYRKYDNYYRTSNSYQNNDQKINQRNQRMYQTSVQCYQSEQLQDQALIQSYIYEDFQNLMNLIFSLQAVTEYFNNDPNNDMVILSRNKVIAQLNISNSIHYDLYQTYKDPKYKELIKSEKQRVKELISKFPSDIKSSIYLNKYNQNSLSEQIRCYQQPLDQINTATNFNQNVVSQIFSSMQYIDKKVSQLKSQNQYTVPTQFDVLAKARQYYMLTQNKLQVNFPKKQKQEYQSQIHDKGQQFYATQSERNQSWKNSPQLVQSQIITHPKYQRYQSTQHYQQGMSRSSYIGGFQNLANC